MPCKHMFTVMEHVHETSWESFCPKYQDSVYFKIDFEAIRLTDVPYLDSKNVLGEDNVLSNDTEKVEDIPLPVHNKSTKSSQCGEILTRSSI